MTKFEVIKAITDEQKFSELVFDLIVKYDSPDAFAKLLSEEFSENELQTLQSIANRGNYPLSLEGREVKTAVNMDRLDELTGPLVEYLAENCRPHSAIIITAERTAVMETVLSKPQNKKELKNCCGTSQEENPLERSGNE